MTGTHLSPHLDPFTMSSTSSPSDASPHESVHAFPDHEALSRAAAQHVVAHMRTVLTTSDRYTLALAGGSTPQRLYALLASTHGGDFPWSRVHVFWGDERMVPPDDPASNTRMARETLLEPAGVPESNVHPMPVHLPPDDAAAAYEETLRSHFGSEEQTFDAVLLGLGADGHTASLFPENAPTPSDAAWVRPVDAPPRYDVTSRLTCTLSVINRASQALFLVSGREKREALSGVLDDRDDTLPATHVRPTEQLTWFVDYDARPPTS